MTCCCCDHALFTCIKVIYIYLEVSRSDKIICCISTLLRWQNLFLQHDWYAVYYRYQEVTFCHSLLSVARISQKVVDDFQEFFGGLEYVTSNN